MELIAQLVHAESGRRVVEVRAFEGSHLLGSALGEATDAEGAEDRARQRLLARLAQSALSETAVSDAASLVEPAGVLDPGEGYPAVVSPGALFPVLKTAAVPPPRAMGAESRSRPQALAEPVAKSPPPPPARITNQPALARSGRSAGAIEAGGGDHAAGSAPQDEARLAAAVAQADGGARSGEAHRGGPGGGDHRSTVHDERLVAECTCNDLTNPPSGPRHVIVPLRMTAGNDDVEPSDVPRYEQHGPTTAVTAHHVDAGPTTGLVVHDAVGLGGPENQCGS